MTIEITMNEVKKDLDLLKSGKGFPNHPQCRPHVILDLTYSLPQLEEIITFYQKRDIYDSIWREKLRLFLKGRWKIIGKSPLCYTANSYYLLNKICTNLARELDPEHVNSLLMPTVLKEDDMGESIDEIDIKSLMISDEDKPISIPSLIEVAIAKIKARETPYLVTSGKDGIRELSFFEKVRLGNIVEKLEEMNSLLVCKESIEQLRKLQHNLYDGAKEDDSNEMFAGVSIYNAVRNFSEFYLTLSDKEKIELEELSAGSKSISGVLGILLPHKMLATNKKYKKDKTRDGIAYCARSLSYDIDHILTENESVIFQNEQYDVLDSRKRDLLEMLNLSPSLRIDIARYSEQAPVSGNYLYLLNSYLPKRKTKLSQEILYRLEEFCMCEVMQRSQHDFDSKLNDYAELAIAIGMECKQADQYDDARITLLIKAILPRLFHLVYAVDNPKQESKGSCESTIRFRSTIFERSDIKPFISPSIENMQMITLDEYRTSFRNIQLKIRSSELDRYHDSLQKLADDEEEQRRVALFDQKTDTVNIGNEERESEVQEYSSFTYSSDSYHKYSFFNNDSMFDLSQDAMDHIPTTLRQGG